MAGSSPVGSTTGDLRGRNASFALKIQDISVVPNFSPSKVRPEGNWNHCSLSFVSAFISGGGYYLTITDGLVSSLPNDGTIVTSAKIDHGSSGGLAVDKNGCMIGIPSMMSGDDNESLGVLISNSVIAEFEDKVSALLKK